MAAAAVPRAGAEADVTGDGGVFKRDEAVASTEADVTGDGGAERTVYEYVGGIPFFERLVDAFYAGVEHDPVLRPMYPDDLTGPKFRLTGFLVQYWGGPTDYSDRRGHPRLRMRHAPFVIDATARDAWLGHMAAAVAAAGADDVVAGALLAYFDQAATAMINTRDGDM